MFKDYVQNLIKISMDEANANVAMSIIYGDTTNLDEDIQKDFETIGVSHLMSVSGTHITSFIIIINAILRVNKNKKNKVKYIIQIMCIVIYIIFTGAGVSVIRAGIMLIVSIICEMLDKRKNKYMLIIITLLIILLLNPYAIFNTGARLSFFATLGILLFRKHINKLFEKLTRKIKNKKVEKVTEYIIQNVAITIAVQLLIVPIQIQAFNRLPFPVIIPNLILGLISTPIRIIGTIAIIVSFIPVLSTNIFIFIEVFVEALIYVAKMFKSISFSISTVSQPLVFYVLYYLLIIIIFIWFKLNSVKDVNGKYNLKKLLKYLIVIGIIVFVTIFIMVIILNIYSIYFSEYVYFFNVEQGDMSYIKCGQDSIIVDIGSMRNNLSYNVISNYFKVSNLSGVDAIIISHMHKDHINGLEKFVKNYNVGIVIYSRPKEESSTFVEFIDILNKYNISSKEVKKGDKITIGKIAIQVLLPDNEYIDSVDHVNSNSLICKITVQDKQLLYMGDASSEAERKLLRQISEENINNIYILKVGHHGSKTATSKEFVQKVKPQNAVISALKKYYGHPHDNTINTLKENNVYTYLTEKQGAIKFVLN